VIIADGSGGRVPAICSLREHGARWRGQFPVICSSCERYVGKAGATAVADGRIERGGTRAGRCELAQRSQGEHLAGSAVLRRAWDARGALDVRGGE